LAKLKSVHITDPERVKIYRSMVVHKISQVLKSRPPKTIPGNHYKPAAVLIPIQEREDGDYLVLTKRADNLSTHSGQVAFPGGRVDAGDRGAEAAALRESHEEIGVHPRDVRILGRLDQAEAGYGFLVTPFVGVIPASCEFVLNPAETSAVCSVPISTLLQPPNFTIDDYVSPRGHPRYHFYVNGWDVWGVTARILVQFLELVYEFRAESR
jgi:8-oxo-dGTP pyrophosphatase MutT (NUDIX family)